LEGKEIVVGLKMKDKELIEKVLNQMIKDGHLNGTAKVLMENTSFGKAVNYGIQQGRELERDEQLKLWEGEDCKVAQLEQKAFYEGSQQLLDEIKEWFMHRNI